MGNRTYRPTRYEHPTETDPRVFSYLQERFGTTPTVSQTGADLIMSDGVTVEVKSTQEWQKSNHSRGGRRRGRFCLHGYEDCDFMLFVICRQDGDLEMYLLKYLTVLERFGVTCTINWKDIVNGKGVGMEEKRPQNPERDRTCNICGEKWRSPVRFAKVGEVVNISGERTEFCPKCGKSDVRSEPYL